ncbi:DUF6586 family protein [Marinobacter sp.]|uniref:DUF6586 family protein n=1 Tax=Marinobacter sp. TaxID=50741 RepID=UPI0019A88C87|nr:DUF6586 family protein [Marinobacter sp.]MBC7191845.1 hypothetical protein [Marinobacter sp.]
MASQWHTLVAQKLFLAKHLVRQTSMADSTTASEAGLQGATELALRARQLMLTMIARFYQLKQAEPDSIEELTALLDRTAPEPAELESLARQPGSWWQHLDQLERFQSQPPNPKKPATDENVIAVAAAQGPDRSAEALSRTLEAARQFAQSLEERHREW